MEASRLESRIKEAEAADKTATACELLRLYLDLGGSKSYFQFLFAEQLRILGRSGEAETIFKDLMALLPAKHAWRVALSLGLLYRDRGEFDKAQATYAECGTLRGESTIPWVYLGGFLASKGDIAEAVKVLTRGLDAEGDRDEVYLNLGNCARAMGDYRTAIQHYSKAIGISPDYELARKALMDVQEALEVREVIRGTTMASLESGK